MFRSLLLAAGLLAISAPVWGQTRDEKVRNDRRDVLSEGYWLYNDLPAALKQSKQTGKPILVVLRCIPCESCHGMDLQVVNRDAAIRDLLDKFVCLRIIKANSLDLSLFQFDYDMSFSVFFLDGDGTVYGRFGTRSTRNDTTPDISLEGLQKAMEGALELHRDAVLGRAQFAHKRQALMDVAKPEELPSLATYKTELDYDGKLAQSCIHCHQIRDAHRAQVRSTGEPLPEPLLYPYPKPDVVGLVLDPKERATVTKVLTDSQGEKDGFRSGDELLTLAGQPLLSIADVQWVLHTAKQPSDNSPTKLPAEVRRNGKPLKLTLTLAPGYRKHDISWRPTTWDLRRMIGGLLLEDLPDEERASRGLASDTLALQAKHVGQYGPHARAKQAGFQTGDVVVGFDDVTSRWSETDLLEEVAQRRKPEDSVTFHVLRGDKRLKFSLKLQ